jgi:hypothetical protein
MPALSHKIEFENAELVLWVGVLFDPQLFPQQSAQLRSKITADVNQVHPLLLNLCEENNIKFNVHLVAPHGEPKQWFAKYAS